MSSYSCRNSVPVRTVNGEDQLETERDAVWQKLTDFHRWQEWLPQANRIELPDPPPPGRGTRLLVNTDSGPECWQLSFWQGKRRLVFQIHRGTQQRALAITLSADAENRLQLLTEFEVALEGWRRLCKPLLAPMYARRAAHFARSLQAWLQIPTS